MDLAARLRPVLASRVVCEAENRVALTTMQELGREFLRGEMNA